MEKNYKGTIVLESLLDDRILNEFEFLNFRVTTEENPHERWHLITVQASENDIKKLAANLNSKKWYSHFWKGDNIIAVFRNQVFYFKKSDKSSWEEAINFGISMGIPKSQLDFLIEEI